MRCCPDYSGKIEFCQLFQSSDGTLGVPTFLFPPDSRLGDPPGVAVAVAALAPPTTKFRPIAALAPPPTEPLSCIRAWVGWLSSLARGMEVRGEPQSGASCSSSPRDGSAVSVSKELLTAGSGGRGGDGRVAAAWGVHVPQGACGRGSGGGRPAAPCPGPLPPRGRPGLAAGLLSYCYCRGGVRGPRGRHPAAGPGMVVVFRTIVGAHSAECSSRTPALRVGPGEGLRSALRSRQRAGGGSRSLLWIHLPAPTPPCSQNHPLVPCLS